MIARGKKRKKRKIAGEGEGNRIVGLQGEGVVVHG